MTTLTLTLELQDTPAKPLPKLKPVNSLPMAERHWQTLTPEQRQQAHEHRKQLTEQGKRMKRMARGGA